MKPVVEGVLIVGAVLAATFIALTATADATPPAPHLGHISERLFTDVPTPLAAAPLGPEARVERLRGAPEHRAGAPLVARRVADVRISAPAPRDAAGRGAAQTPAAATPLPAIPRKEVPSVRSATGVPVAQPVRATATWYADPSLPSDGLYAAIGSWRWGDTPYRLTVSANGRTVVVTVRDHCHGCMDGRPYIDLSPAAFAALAPLSRGVLTVRVTR